jgi:cytochrome b561
MTKYSASSRAIHWFMALIIFSALGVGIYMTKILPKDAPNHLEVYSLHKSIGVIALLFVILRIINRFIFKVPALPKTIKKHEQILSHLGHFGLYVLMVTVPLSGYLMSNSFGFPVHLFSIELPFLIERNFELGKILSEFHEISAYCLLALVSVHILAVVKHRFFDKPENDVLKRML